MSDDHPQVQASTSSPPEEGLSPRVEPAASALSLGPEWTIAQASELHTQLLGALQSGQALTLDLSSVESIDSAGIQLLLALRATLHDRGQALGIAATSETVRAALAVYRLEDILNPA